MPVMVEAAKPTHIKRAVIVVVVSVYFGVAADFAGLAN
jgi:hypothetical protein